MSPFWREPPLAVGWSSEVYATDDPNRVLKLARPLVPGFEDELSRNNLLSAWSREAAALVAVRGVVGVVRLLSFGRLGERPWLLLSRVEGLTLWQRVQDKPLRPDQVCLVLRQLVTALTAVHGTGWLHLDLNPGNVIIDDTGILTLLDFGAVQRQRAIDTWSWPLGRHRYMAHEHLHGRVEEPRYRRLCPATDVHQLACLVMFLLSGQEPFRGCAPDEDYAEDYLTALTAWTAQPAATRVAEVLGGLRWLPSGVQDVLARALDACPDSRTATPLHFARQFHNAVERS